MNDAFKRELEVFGAAVKLSDPAARQQFLIESCAGDEDLLQRVNALLHANLEAGTFLQSPPSELRTVLSDAVRSIDDPTTGLSEKPGQRIGRYKLLQQIGEGGMGVVYMAEQEEPVRRRVALKIIKLGMDTRQVVARFEAERQALALMDHPNIAKVLDGGATETGRPYFVMELVQGVPITDFCDKTKLPARDRLKLFIQVCQAIQSAHQKGIIHRDIKPSNVLVTLHDGVPVPKVIDFGIAKATNQKLTEKTLFTNFATLIGTPAYMSPEQAEMSGLDIDTRTDIYALGVLLYALLTGTTPFPEKRLRSLGYGEMQRVILEEEPERPSTRLSTMENEERTLFARNCGEELTSLNKLLRGDLDWIVMKCLEKDRQRRYETANGLASDIQRHLANEPVIARPPSAGYKLQKAWRRHQAAYTAGLIALFCLTLSLIISVRQTSLAVHARNQAREAEIQKDQEARVARQERNKALHLQNETTKSERETRRNLYAADILAAQRLIDEGNLGTAKKVLESHNQAEGREDLRGWEWRYLTERLRGDHLRVASQIEHTGTSLEVSSDERYLAAGDKKGSVFIWNLSVTPPALHHQFNLQNWVKKVGFTTSGRHFGAVTTIGQVKIWNLGDRSTPSLLIEKDAASFAFIPGKEQVAILLTNGVIEIKDLQGERLRSLTPLPPESLIQRNPNPYNNSLIAVSTNAQRLVTNIGRKLRVWNLLDLTYVDSNMPDPTEGRAKSFSGLAFLEHHDSLVTTSFDVGPEFWRVEATTITHLENPSGQDRNLTSLAVAANGHFIVFGGHDHSVRIWNSTNRMEERKMFGHQNEVWTVAVSQSGRIFSSGQDSHILEWSRHPNDLRTVIEGAFTSSDWSPSKAIYSPNGEWMAIGQRSGRAALINLNSGLIRSIGTIGDPLMFTADGEALYLAELTKDSVVDSKLAHWLATGRILRVNLAKDTIQPEIHGQALNNPVKSWRCSGNILGLGLESHLKSITFRDIISGETVLTLESLPLLPYTFVRYFDVSPDRTSLVLSDWDDWDNSVAATAYSISPPHKIATLAGHARTISRTAFSPDNSLFATGSHDGSIRLWRTDTWTTAEGGILQGHKRGTFDVSFSPDGKTLASANDDGTIKLWNVNTKRLMLTLAIDDSPNQVTFSSNSRTLAVLSGSDPEFPSKITLFTTRELGELTPHPPSQRGLPTIRRTHANAIDK